MRKRMLAMLLACCLIGGTLSGCGGKTETVQKVVRHLQKLQNGTRRYFW